MKPLQHFYFHIPGNTQYLKNGSNHTYDEIMKAIEFIKEFNRCSPSLFFELVKKCRFENYTLQPACARILENLEVLRDNQVNEVIRDVILSCVSGRTPYDLEVTTPLSNDKPHDSFSDW